MKGLVKEYVDFLNNDTKHASEKFWELEKRIKKDRKHPGVIMEMSKSQAIWNIVELIRLDTYGDWCNKISSRAIKNNKDR